MGEYRVERDTLGEIQVPKEVLWGAQTQRSLNNFQIGDEIVDRMPIEIVHAISMIKQAASVVNAKNGLPSDMAKRVFEAAQEVQSGMHDEQFPLTVWQTGSGTQTNMNVNEVIATIANSKMADSRCPQIHPNDHVNKSQSSNDTFPTALHIAVCLKLKNHLMPSIGVLISKLGEFIDKHGNVIKVGRTHLQDATPLTFGQEFSGYVQQLLNSRDRIESTFTRLTQLAQGATAVGTVSVS